MPDGVNDRSSHQAFEFLSGLESKLQASQRQPLVLSEAVPEQLSVRPSPLTASPLTASIVSTPAEVLDFTAFVSSLAPEPGMLSPRFFLASLLPRFCRPCVVVVSQGSKVAGLLYTRERVVAGIPTGIVLGDDTLGAMIVARPEETESVMQCAVQALLKHKTALRFRVASDHLALLQAQTAKANAEIHFFSQEFHAHLELPRTYDGFLAKFRSHTRHNFCRYRRRSELAGNEFCPDLSFTEFCVAAQGLFPKEAHARHESNFRQCLAMIEAMPSRILIGLRRSTGEWVSLAGGWYAGDRAVLNLQLNDRTCVRESVSLVLRSYLIEQLINRGIREVIFWAGTSAPLSYYITHREEYMTYVDSRSHPWRLVRLACVTLAKLAPATFGKWLKWDAPDVNGNTEQKDSS
ncbi:MAG TPA: hypothetical protein VK805_20100 [Candidatus Baltobacteraceae bacterium]|nr:hypothetical protein [Candidatus Baltobacteraceae bacterium]